MRRNRTVLALAVIIALLLPVSAFAQQTGSEGVNTGNYNVKQTIEFGYRTGDISGNPFVYNTFVNLQNGPRLLGYTLESRSLNHSGLLFDNLFVDSFGIGGDPSSGTRVRMSKDHFYNFSGNYRREQNFWDYNMFANPLNPNSGSLISIVTDSPHKMNTRRHMGDFDLTFLPDSDLSVRLGYSRVDITGPAWTSMHEGTDVQFLQDTRNASNNYRLGADLKVGTASKLSFDQYLSFFKGDSFIFDNNQTYLLPPSPLYPSGTMGDLGLPINTAAGQPCAAPLTNGMVTPTCNVYINYNRFTPTRTSSPTSVLTFTSSAAKNLDLSAHFAYGWADSVINNISDNFLGLVTRTREQTWAMTGSTNNNRITTNGDINATYTVNDRLRLLETFRFINWRGASTWNNSELATFNTTIATLPNKFLPSTCPAPYTATTCPQHNSSAPADVTKETVVNFLGMRTMFNEVMAEFDVNRKLGFHAGYRYVGRRIGTVGNFEEAGWESVDELFYPNTPLRGDCAGATATTPGVTLLPDGTCHFVSPMGAVAAPETAEYKENSFLAGFWAKPTTSFKVGGDFEIRRGDNEFRVSPKNLEKFKIKASYKPVPWTSFSGQVDILQNTTPDAGYTDRKDHNHIAGFNFSLMPPNQKVVANFGYTYTNLYSATDICFLNSTFNPPGTTLGGCPVVPPGGFVTGLNRSVYDNTTHFVFTDLLFTPEKHVSFGIGMNYTDTSGSSLLLNPLENPIDTYKFVQPTVTLAIAVSKNVTLKSAWNHYSYNDGNAAVLLPDRGFHGNLGTFSIKYAF